MIPKKQTFMPKQKVAIPKSVSTSAGNSSPFPTSMPITIKYGDFWMLSGSGGFKVQSFRLNSLYDPDLTGVGGTPTYAAQLAEVYSSYKVEAVDIKVQFFNLGTTVPLVGYIWHSSNESPVSSQTQIQQVAIEGRNSLSACMPTKGTNAGSPFLTLRKSLNLSNVEGAALDDAFRANFGANPAKVIHLDVFAVDTLGINEPSVEIAVTLTFKGKVFGRLANTYTD